MRTLSSSPLHHTGPGSAVRRAAAIAARRAARVIAAVEERSPDLVAPALNRTRDQLGDAAATLETAAHGYSRTDYWAVDNWVGRTLPNALTRATGHLPALLALATRDAAASVALLRDTDNFLLAAETTSEHYNVPVLSPTNAEHVSASFTWLAAAAPVILRDDPTGAARAWFSNLAGVLDDHYGNLHGWPCEHPDYPEFEDWRADIHRLAETAHAYARTGDPSYAAEIFAWFGTGKILHLWD